MENEIFVQRVKEGMADKELNIPALAKSLKCDRRAIDRWLDGKFLPKTEMLIKLTEVLEMNSDYLMGMSLESELSKEKDESNFSERLRALLREKNITAYKLAKETQIPRINIGRWLRLENTPDVTALIKLSQFFNCSLEYLLGREKVGRR